MNLSNTQRRQTMQLLHDYQITLMLNELKVYAQGEAR